MSFSLEFDPRALREWQKLDASLREQFKNKLAKLLESPVIPANKLKSLPNCYKIKLRCSGYRLVYQVQNEKLVVLVVALGKREKSQAYKQANKRL